MNYSPDCDCVPITSTIGRIPIVEPIIDQTLNAVTTIVGFDMGRAVIAPLNFCIT